MQLRHHRCLLQRRFATAIAIREPSRTTSARHDAQHGLYPFPSGDALFEHAACGLILADVTERKEAQTVLLRQAAIFEHLSDATVITDLRGNITERRRTEQQLKRLNHELSKADRRKDESSPRSRTSCASSGSSIARAMQSAMEAARPTVQASSHHLSVTLPPEALYLDADPHTSFADDPEPAEQRREIHAAWRQH